MSTQGVRPLIRNTCLLFERFFYLELDYCESYKLLWTAVTQRIKPYF